MRILVLTVGGSSQPLVSSIRQNRPDRLAFLCSDDTPGTKGSYIEVEGQGKVCEKGTLPNIILQSGAENIPWEIVKIKELDSPDACYLESLALLTRLRQEYPDATIIADYTGGTKSMSSGLVLAALDTKGVVLGVQAGLRANREKISPGTQFTRLTHGYAPLIHRQQNAVANAFARFDYPTAIALLEDILTIPDLPSESTQTLQLQLTLARGLNAWDRFDHATAWEMLRPLHNTHVRLTKFLEFVLWSRSRLDPSFDKAVAGKLGEKPKGHGYELIQDLVLNAERRAAQARYDDAIGRLYRTVEMLAQARLKYSFGIDAADVDIEKVPPQLKPKYAQKRSPRDNKIKTALMDDYELLDALGDPALGSIFNRNKGALLDFLGFRNNSLFAHGYMPIAESDYRKARTLLKPFLEDGIQAIIQGSEGASKPYAAATQFPQSLGGSLTSPPPSPPGKGA